MRSPFRLHELFGYEEYAAFDEAVHNFTLPPGN
jgi:methylisocitrate lyase